MSDEKNGNWQELCRAIQAEKDPDEVRELVRRLNAILDTRRNSTKVAANLNGRSGSESTSSQRETVISHKGNSSDVK